MFCTTLRKRKAWASAVPVLLQSQAPKFSETKFESHDVALQLPLTPSAQSRELFCRFMLLSQVEVGSEQTKGRIDRLCHLTGGTDVAIVFLLGECGDPSAFMQFQIDMMDKFEIPLIPLSSTQELPSTLARFHKQHVDRITSSQQPRALSNQAQSTMQVLLPHCALKPRLSEHAVNILSDITTGCADLADKVRTEEGRELLREYLGPEDAGRVIMFWSYEYTFEH